MNMRTYEARVEVTVSGTHHYYAPFGKYIDTKIVRMFHIPARNQEQAKKKAERYGRPISIRKVNIEEISGNIETLQNTINPKTYPNAIAMDEFIWQRKSKRGDRLEDRKRDKPEY